MVSFFGRPLCSAAFQDNFNAIGGFYDIVFQAAAYHGSERAVRLLIENGASVSTNGGQYQGRELNTWLETPSPKNLLLPQPPSSTTLALECDPAMPREVGSGCHAILLVLLTVNLG